MILDLEFQKRVLLNLTCFIVANIASLNLLETDSIKNRLDGDINTHETHGEIIKKITGYFFFWILFFIIIYSLLVLFIYISISMWLHIFDPQETNGFASGLKWVKNLFWKWKDGTPVFSRTGHNLLYYWIILTGAICLNLLYLPYLSSLENHTSEIPNTRQPQLGNTNVAKNSITTGLDSDKTSPIVILTNFLGLSTVGITILFIILLLLNKNDWWNLSVVIPILLLYLTVNCLTIKANLDKKYFWELIVLVLPVVLVLFWIFSNYRVAHINK